ncbi:MAG: HAMP domain-containing protein [Anaerolineales bacterium]|nr:HAMP domain-containing protein [Anaerolineales bacterium]
MTASISMPWSRLSVQSKILIVMMAVSIVSVLLIGYLGYRSGRAAIEANSFLRLDGLRQLRTDQLQTFFADARSKVNLMSVLSADELREFRTAYQELARTATVTPEQEEAIQNFYVDTYLPKLADNLQSNPSVEGFLPATAVQEYLQYYYTVPNGGGSGADIDDPGDGSAYSQVHRQRHPLLRSFVQPGEDLIFIDGQSGEVIYTTDKHVDLGTNLLTGPFSGSALADAFREARKSGDEDFTIVTDFDSYRPAYGNPAIFVASPVFDNGQMIGVAAVRLASQELVNLTSGDEQWQSDGLGVSGDVYLVGPDNKMRSQARGMIEHAGIYTATLLENGVSPNDVAHIERLGTTIDTLSITSKPIEAALRGETGTIQSLNYLGDPVLSSFAPLQLQDLHWGIVAEITQAEALAPAQDFTQLLAVYMVCIILFVIFAGLFLTHLVTKPLRQLTAHARQVAAGDYSGELEIGSHDEVGELANAFNDMTQSLRTKQALINDQNETLENCC